MKRALVRRSEIYRGIYGTNIFDLSGEKTKARKEKKKESSRMMGVNKEGFFIDERITYVMKYHSLKIIYWIRLCISFTSIISCITTRLNFVQ